MDDNLKSTDKNTNVVDSGLDSLLLPYVILGVLLSTAPRAGQCQASPTPLRTAGSCRPTPHNYPMRSAEQPKTKASLARTRTRDYQAIKDRRDVKSENSNGPDNLDDTLKPRVLEISPISAWICRAPMENLFLISD
jgi:hypothetical protein